MTDPKTDIKQADPLMSQCIRFLLNGEEIALSDVRPTETLLDFLRLKRRLTGTKEGCAEGDCGACTVLVGRIVEGALAYESVNACIRFLGSLHATHVVTVEHLSAPGAPLHPIQQAIADEHGSQCGFCTPGFVMSLYGLWLGQDNPGRAGIEKALQGNLCRCTGYEPIVVAAEKVTAARPSAVFDPLERTRAEVMERLSALAGDETIEIASSEGRLIVPGTVEALAELLAREPAAVIVAGSTDTGLWVTKQMRKLDPVVFTGHLAGLQAVTVEDGAITIGAGVTYSQAFRAMATHIPAFAALIDRIGGDQVRNMGTIGGNIANGSPIGDSPPPLIALGATLTLRSAEGRRTLPLEAYFIDYGKQDRRPGEFVESVRVPLPPPTARFAVYKVTKRRDEDITAVLGAFYLDRDAAGIVTTARIAYGGMAATPKRAAAVEAALCGKPLSDETLAAARAAYDADFTPLSDWRATAAYRQLTAKNLLTRFALELAGDRQELVRFDKVAAHG